MSTRALAEATPAQAAAFRRFVLRCAQHARRGQPILLSPSAVWDGVWADLGAWPAWLRRQAQRLALTYCARLGQGAPAALAEALAPGADLFLAPNASWQPPGPGLGAWAPGRVTLLVGDRPGPAWRSRLNWPFISGLRSGCSAWLAGQLESAGVPEQQLYWVNAADQHGTPTDGTFVAALRPQLVVALGQHAATWCEAVCLAGFEQVHHPQHWQRFHAGHKYRLTQLLRRRHVR